MTGEPRGFSQVEVEFSNYYWEFRLPLVLAQGLNDFTFTSHFHALEKEMATHSSVLVWRIPGTGKPGGL